ncbi:uncharacterized protein LOC133878120 [Alnus glutinosa]|uniref:uncharacterized protein LOC133878120 n=1 Tax=Alnus glutinosa TaxID=3517 RepID=UPI002D764DD0|nr:uncharacterized protein LOC133878120 [Alnus glutinosa]XP_062172607.1 uncharacterized protein LOC133878120 [Alnus glutinosa]XP_062172608.1 uncharacterized protein LOC133878120 [Alnus glutinosa]
MEALYSKLYDKYTKLKTKKWSELDKLSKDQEEKFVNYMNAAEELIQHLKNENDQLRAQIDDLRSEVASTRSTNDEQFADYQKNLMEESQKNKALAEELEKLRKQQQEGILGSIKDGENVNAQLNMPGGAQGMSEVSNRSSRIMTRKRSRLSGTVSQDDAMQREAAKNLSKETGYSNAAVNVQQPECCRRTIDASGGALKESGSANCFFQAFVEYLVGMKLSAVNQTQGMCISALHQSSGYSFSLTWVDKAAGEEAELLYRVLSLGTFERVAPEWMREVIIFSTSMCPVFFERVSRVIKLHH